MGTVFRRGLLLTLVLGCAGGNRPEPTPPGVESPDDDEDPAPPGFGGVPTSRGTGGTAGSPAVSAGPAAGAAGAMGAEVPPPSLDGAARAVPDGGAEGPARGSDGTAADAASGWSGDAAGGASPCVGAKFLLCEGFEAAATLPAGWSRSGSVQVVSDEAYRGARSLQINAAALGARRIVRAMSIPGSHWGRVFYKVRVPAPRPASGVIHSTMVALAGTSPVGGRAEWRVLDTVENSLGRHQFLYNVQPVGRGEFGRGSSYRWSYDGKWHCAEWSVDAATQSYRFFIDGAEVTQIAIANGAGNYRGSELPAAFTSIAVGWNNYQNAGAGFAAWFDELALDAKRIGCAN